MHLLLRVEVMHQVGDCAGPLCASGDHGQDACSRVSFEQPGGKWGVSSQLDHGPSASSMHRAVPGLSQIQAVSPALGWPLGPEVSTLAAVPEHPCAWPVGSNSKQFKCGA